MKPKSVNRVKKEATHDFFPRQKKMESTSGNSFEFNKAPINKQSAYAETRTKVIADREDQAENRLHGRKQTTFLSKLYKDDDEFDELKVLGGIDEDDNEVTEARNEASEKIVKRKTKMQEKSAAKPIKKDKTAKIGKLNLKKDSLALFAICEVTRDYLIVNHTRNSKGYIQVTAKDAKENQYRRGQLIMAQVNAEVGGASTGDIYNFQSGKAGLNRKVQLSTDLKFLNKMLSISQITKNMVLMGVVETKEAKGYIINFGMRDQSSGFLKLSDIQSETITIGQKVHALVKTVAEASKVIRCELLSKANNSECVQQPKQESNLEDEFKLTAMHLKPGFLVSSKVSKIYENGIEITFLGGMTGTVFQDHVDPSITELKIGTKLNARIIGVNILQKRISLSTLQHIVEWDPNATRFQKQLPSIGETFGKAKVAKHLYGNSYLIDYGKGMGFLHKLHMLGKVPEVDEMEDDELAPPKFVAQEVFEVGHVLPEVKVKEINFFDRMPMLTVKDDMLKQSHVNYHTIKAGAYLEATIIKVNVEQNYVSLSVNEFIKGNLYLEHMADTPIKVMPPKFTVTGRAIKVRVLSVDVQKRFIEFTKKDSFMKDDAPVYQNYREPNKGDKILCNVVGHKEHGLVVKSFGNIKGLLTYEDIMQKEKITEIDQKDYKTGTVLKAYVLFKKAGTGIALTLSKKKAKRDDEEDEEKGGHKTLEKSFFPSDEALDAILTDSKFATLINNGKNSRHVGQVFNFRLIEREEDQSFYILKSLDAAKKSKNFVALLPKCLLTNFSRDLSINLSADGQYQGMVIEIYRNSLPIVSIQPDLIALKDQILTEEPENLAAGMSHVGICNGLVGKGGQVGVRFFNGISKTIKVKDLNQTVNYNKIYTPGQLLRVAVNKLDRLCTKQTVVEMAITQKQLQADKIAQVEAFSSQFVLQAKGDVVELGQEVQVEVTYSKENLCITQITEPKLSNVQSGFLMEHHKLSSKVKAGQKLRCRILDVDYSKKMADLKELPKEGNTTSVKEMKPESKQKCIVELNKNRYMIVSFKNSRNTLGVVLSSNFNQDMADDSNVQIGDEIEVNVHRFNKEGNFYELIPVMKPKEKKASTAAPKESIAKLNVGLRVTGTIKGIKGSQVFVQMPRTQSNPKIMQIGRLHQIECGTETEFKSFVNGDRIDCKILSIEQNGDKQWIELTRNAKHLAKLQGLDDAELKRSPQKIEDLKKGEKYSAIVISYTDEAVNLKNSQPLMLQISPFIRGTVAFNQIMEPKKLLKQGGLAVSFDIGQRVDAYYVDNNSFTLIEKSKKQQSFKKGDLVTARYVKYIPGKGVTAQISLAKADHQFGFVPICEISDENLPNVVQHLVNAGVFAARIIDFETKTGKPILSTRSFVTQEATWKTIGGETSSIVFKAADEINQSCGNMRNMILKYGADVAIERGDLAIGYVVNIGKAGCFIQIGHNCTARAGLNELSDSTSFDFAKEFPLGRQVIGRISVVREPTEGGPKRFDFSTRQSLTVYGVGVTDRSKLAVDDTVEAIVMAIAAEGKAFAQIKGSYIKMKVKEMPKKIKVGDQVSATLKKVTKEKISSIFVSALKSSECFTSDQIRIHALHKKIQDDAHANLDSIRSVLQQSQDRSKQNQDFDASLIDQKNFLGKDEQIAQQIADLEELDQHDEDSEMEKDDSDEDEMKRVLNQNYESDKSMSEEAEEEQSDEEMQVGSDEEDISDESAEEEQEDVMDSGSEKLVGKKRTLKDRLKEEQSIRAKEKEMRSGDAQPKDIDDFERLLIANQDQSYLWIQYIAFMLDNLGVEAARKVAERAIKAVSMSNEEDKLNIWTAFMNLESNFGSQETLESVTKRALDVNDRRQVYAKLIEIYKQNQSFEYIEPIYKQLVKKFSNNIDLWSRYLEFLFEMRSLQKEKSAIALQQTFTEPKLLLQKSLQALTKDNHVAMISKFGMLEFKQGSPESGRTMFEGIVSNYPKRMDIWVIYMDMESKYGQNNVTQARHLFERCLSNENIQKKPKKMKLVFQKYMEYEKTQGNKNNLQDLRKRVEEYLSKAFGNNEQSSQEEEASD